MSFTSSRKTIREIMAGAPIYPGTKAKKIDNNTVRYTDTEGRTRIRLHCTDVVIRTHDGIETLFSGGYLTSTTKARINKYAKNCRIYQERGDWYAVVGGHEKGKTYLFADGIAIGDEGTVIGAGDLPKRKNPLVKKIKAYAQAFADALPVAPPSGGDCWGCCLRDQNAQPGIGTDHLLSHIEENYFVPSLLARVLEVNNVGVAWRWAAFKGESNASPLLNGNRSQYRRWITKYLTAVLIDGKSA